MFAAHSPSTMRGAANTAPSTPDAVPLLVTSNVT
jgi:hypothetical protein